MDVDTVIRDQCKMAAFTLVELLLSLVIMSMIASFAIIGVKLSNKAWTISRAADEQGRIDAAVDRLTNLFSQTMPAEALDRERGIASLKFRGETTGISFVTLSEGYALRGGLIDVQLVWNRPGSTTASSAKEDGTISIRTGVFRPNGSSQWGESTVMLRGVTNVEISYYGATEARQDYQWYSTWIQRDRLPALLSLNLSVRILGALRNVRFDVPLRHASM